MRRLFLLVATILMPLSHGAAASPMEVKLNSASILTLERDAVDVIVGDPAYVDITVQTPRRLILFGKTLGQTNLIILGRNGREIVAADVVVNDGSDLRIRYPLRGAGAKRTDYYSCSQRGCTLMNVNAQGGLVAQPVGKGTLEEEPGAGGEKEFVGEEMEETVN